MSSSASTAASPASSPGIPPLPPLTTLPRSPRAQMSVESNRSKFFDVSDCALLFTKGHRQRHHDSQKIKVTISNVNGISILFVSVSDDAKKAKYDIRFSDNVSGAAAYIVGQSVHWDNIELYVKSIKSDKEVLAKWSLMLDNNKCLNNDICSVKSILDTLKMQSLSRLALSKRAH